MRPLTDLPDDVRFQLRNRDVIVFDGECVLCSGFFKFMLRHDRASRFDFVIAQSSLGASIYTALGLPVSDFETNLVIVDGQIFERLDAFAAAMRALGWPWRVLSVCRWLPTRFKSALYNCIARNRYALFGRHDTCMMPDAALYARFLAGGFG